MVSKTGINISDSLSYFNTSDRTFFPWYICWSYDGCLVQCCYVGALSMLSWCFWGVVRNRPIVSNNNYHNHCMHISHSCNIYPSTLCNFLTLFTCNGAIFMPCNVYQQILLIRTFVWPTLYIFWSVQYHCLFEFRNPTRVSYAHFPIPSSAYICRKFWINSQTPTEMKTHFVKSLLVFPLRKNVVGTYDVWQSLSSSHKAYTYSTFTDYKYNLSHDY